MSDTISKKSAENIQRILLEQIGNESTKTSEKQFNMLEEYGVVVENAEVIEEKEIIKEAVKYPSQDEAEALLKWSKALEPLGMSFGGAPMVNKSFNKAEKARKENWDKIFGNKSPWKIVIKSGGKRFVEWDKYKAEQLGLEKV